MITAEHLRRTFGNVTAVDDVSFQVRPGDVLGLLGVNGAGKSTIMRMLTGYLEPDGGTVQVDGHDLRQETAAAQANLGYLPENAPLYSEMTVGGFLRFCGGMRGLRGSALQDAVREAVDCCHLEPVFHQGVDTLSKGYHHRVCFAQAILHHPSNLILDEPTDGLDPNQKAEMRARIREMGRRCALLVSTHILEEVEAMCNRVAVLHHGRLIFDGTPEELRSRAGTKGIVHVRIEASAAREEILAALKSLPGVASGEWREKEQEFYLTPQRADGVLACLVAEMVSRCGWRLQELHTDAGKLEDVFFAMTAEADRVSGDGR